MDVLALALAKRHTDKRVGGPYGIRYDITDPAPEVERVGASKGLRANVSVDNDPVVNDFDSIYPWGDIRVCNVTTTDWGAPKVVYQGDSGFSLDGSNGEVMVEIPKHYYKRYREGNIEYIWISGTPLPGFSIDPAFVENGRELDRIYVGRYDSWVDKVNGIVASKTGVFPTNASYNQLTQFLDDRPGFALMDWRVWSMLQRLFLVEYATRDSQSVMGGLSTLVYHGKTECYAQLSETNTNRIIIGKGFDSNKFRVGQTVIVQPGQGTTDRRTILEINDYSAEQYEIVFDGPPKDIEEGVDQICNVPQINGQTDHLVYPSGRAAGDNMRSAMQYRWIENLWGNIWNLLEGVAVDNLQVRFNMTSGDELKHTLSYKVALQEQIPGPSSTVVYAKTMGYDALHPHLMLPVETGTSTPGSDYWCDGFYSYEEGLYIPAVGGGWDHYERGGLFCWRFWINNLDSEFWLYGGRLVFKPQ